MLELLTYSTEIIQDEWYANMGDIQWKWGASIGKVAFLAYYFLCMLWEANLFPILAPKYQLLLTNG